MLNRRSLLTAGIVAPFLGSPARAGTPPLRDGVALVIGVGGYEDALGPLPNALNDAAVAARALEAIGYGVEMLRDPDRLGLLRAVARLQISGRHADQIVFYFAGHGIMRNGQSELIPAGTGRSAGAALAESVPLSIVIRALSDRPRQKLLFIDACRDNPLWSEPSRADRVPHFALPAGTHVLYATEPGAPALDGDGPVSPFARAFLKWSDEPGLSSEELAMRIRRDVVLATAGAQVPWSQSSLLAPATLNHTGV